MYTSGGYPQHAVQLGNGEASGCSLGAASWESAQTAQEKGKRTSVVCQVAGCGNLGLQEASKYYLRFRICRYHSSLPQMMLNGKLVRFCQQCGRFEDLASFESGMKSCRASLDKHNSRRKRRKVLTGPPPATQVGMDAAAAGAGGLAGAGIPAEAGAEAAVGLAAAAAAVAPGGEAAAGANVAGEPASSPGDMDLSPRKAVRRMQELLPGAETAAASNTLGAPQDLLPHRKQPLPLRQGQGQPCTQPYLRMGSAPAPGGSPGGRPTAGLHTVNILRDLNLGPAQQTAPLVSPFAAAQAAAQQQPPAGGVDQTATLLQLISAMQHVLAGHPSPSAGLQQHSAPLPSSTISTPEVPSPGSAAAETLLQLLLLALAEEAQAAQAAEQAQLEQLQASSLPVVLSSLLGQRSPPLELSWPHLQLQQRSSSLLAQADLTALTSYSQSSLPGLGTASLPISLPLPPPPPLPLSVFPQAGLGVLQAPAGLQGPSQQIEAAVDIVNQLLGRLPSQQHSCKHDAWVPPA